MQALDFLDKLLRYDHQDRLTAREAMVIPFLACQLDYYCFFFFSFFFLEVCGSKNGRGHLPSNLSLKHVELPTMGREGVHKMFVLEMSLQASRHTSFYNLYSIVFCFHFVCTLIFQYWLEKSSNLL